MIYISFCVDWEGDHFKNLSALGHVLDELGSSVPVTHFICPAYFPRFPQIAKQTILSTIRAHDEVGLHLHCFKSLIKQVQSIAFKTQHNYYRQDSMWVRLRDRLLNSVPQSLRDRLLQRLISGRGVPLSVYSASEIERILLFAKNLLQEQLELDKVESFRAGGWIASDEVLHALAKVNIPIDSSAVSPEIVSQGYATNFEGNHRDDYGESYPIFTTYIEKLWGREDNAQGFLKNRDIHAAMHDLYITKTTQPFYFNQILEMPSNCGATDFASLERTFIPVLMQLLKTDALKNGQKPLFMNITCHQEGDLYYKQGMLDFYHYVTANYSHHVRFVTVSEAARIYRASV